MDSATEIKNLLYRYAELIDSGDFKGIGELFGDCVMTADGTEMNLRGPEAITGNYTRSTRLYPDTGTPKTKHVLTNLLVEVDEKNDSASMRSYYTVLQQTDALALQPIIAGRYHQTFARVDGCWRFKTHTFFVDLVGELGQHLLMNLDNAGNP